MSEKILNLGFRQKNKQHLREIQFLNIKYIISNSEATKLEFQAPFYSNHKYREFTKIEKSKILFYSKILLVLIRKTK